MKKAFLIVAVTALLGAIVVGVGTTFFNAGDGFSRDTSAGKQVPRPGAARGPEQPSSSPSPAPAGPVNPPGCPGFEVIAIPGSWESSATDDPINPKANPHALLLNVTRPLQQQFSGNDVKVWTVPYVSQFRNVNDLNQMAYDESRAQGYARVLQEMQATHKACPATKFAVVGFSQGAVIGGDLASELGRNAGPIPADRIAGFALIADGRQTNSQGVFVGNKANTGMGAEIALRPVAGVVRAITPGATMRGPRPGGFGVLNDRVHTYCAKDDPVCDAPRDLGNAIARAQAMISSGGVHGMYATNTTVAPAGRTVSQDIVGWFSELAKTA